MTELKLVVRPCLEWPGAYRIHLATDGRLLAIGRNASETAAKRAIEEGIAGDDTVIVLDYASGASREHARVGDIRKGVKPRAEAA